ncbi:feruloyl esterase B [Sodiomyces alkalinus F11]|uniref:Carboxylic ester hydrolase n=1 Tax=Sodiomyces alkalinus (strain CBS 110278 / VKM F-3762 / F11) TaxID=1314773 RepID=A0A3N2PKV9_SODAK|nr:feruloyl esterase B [Sodiomyces alkalinus F11]ROT35050.1 feruloyl esterase B [Sodiomyces alkalinus F11]
MKATTVLGVASLLLQPAYASLRQISNWGFTPGGLTLHAYIPNNLPPNPAVILALHPCGGSGQGYHQSSGYSPLADTHGFIVLYPSSTKDMNCWDVATTRTLSRDGGGDSQALADMVDWAIANHGADQDRVFVSGTSSGCMMTNVMMATYPDYFAAATCYSGVSAGCLAGSPGSSPISADPTCANGQNIKTPQEWADLARSMYPCYTGPYPPLKTYHGLDDTFVHWRNLDEQLKQWSAIHGVSFSHEVANNPRQGYTQRVYGDGTKLVGVTAQGVGHVVPVVPDEDLRWFGII